MSETIGTCISYPAPDCRDNGDHSDVIRIGDQGRSAPSSCQDRDQHQLRPVNTEREPESTQTPTILIVDDAPPDLALLKGLLEPSFRVRTATSGEHALRASVREPRPDLILLDLTLPEMQGLEVLRRLQANPGTSRIAVIIVSASTAVADEQRGLELGAVDFITKPIHPAILLQRVRNQLALKQARDGLARQNTWLETELTRRMKENQLTQELAMRALACIGEARDNDTAMHIARTQLYVAVLAKRLSDHPRFQAQLANGRGRMIAKAAPLHDLGKIGIPDAILLKPGRLTAEEFAVMKRHPQIGADAILRAMELSLSGADADIARHSDQAFGYLRIAREVALTHHEKWDGSGYPQGLAGDAIPVSGRLMALADVFDALITKRVYKPAWSLEKTTKIIQAARGRHFDPDVADAFLVLRDHFVAIAEQYADPF